MKPILVNRDIVPLGEFKATASKLLKELDERNAPLIVTLNGRPACVVLSPREYDELRARAEIVTAVAEGLDDRRAGRMIDDDDLDQILDQELGPVR